MISIGTVTAVVNDNVLLLQVDQHNTLNVGDSLTIFARLNNDKLREVTGLDHIDVPKGEIRVISKQTDHIYLAERFRQSTSEYKVASPMASGLLGLLLETKTPIPGNWSANFDKKDSLNLEWDRVVRTGDLVAKAF